MNTGSYAFNDLRVAEGFGHAAGPPLPHVIQRGKTTSVYINAR